VPQRVHIQGPIEFEQLERHVHRGAGGPVDPGASELLRQDGGVSGRWAGVIVGNGDRHVGDRDSVVVRVRTGHRVRDGPRLRPLRPGRPRECHLPVREGDKGGGPRTVPPPLCQGTPGSGIPS